MTVIATGLTAHGGTQQMSELIGLTVAERIATLTLARAPVNAFNADMFKAFHGILDGLSARSDWSVLHIR
jgi:enoyl-CoA hydratase/carnithine racemase